MVELISSKFGGKIDYFYLPKDLKTQCGVGYAFINFLHPLLILDFYLEFHSMKWSDVILKCNSTKYCEITYAKMQGIDEIRQEYHEKNVNKKTEPSVKPIFYENLIASDSDLS